MAPRIGQRATLGGKTVVWSGDNYGWQSPASHNKLKEDGKFKLGAQALDRVVRTASNSRVVKAITRFQDRFIEETDKIPGVKQLDGLIDKALNHSPQGVVSRGAGIVTDKTANALNIDPRLAAAGLMLGSVRSGPKFRRPSERGRPPANNKAAIAAQAESAVQAKAIRDRGTISERQRVAEALKGVNVAKEARGPASKQFGAHNISDVWNPASEGLVTVGGSGATGGRPSAAKSSPHLRGLREGVRKQTGLSRVHEALNQRRGQGSPGKAKPPQNGPVRGETSRVTEALKRQQERKAQSQGTNEVGVYRAADYGLDTGNKSTKSREGVLRGSDKNPAPIRRDKDGNIITQPKAEKNTPSITPRERPTNKPITYSGQKPERLTKDQRDALLRENPSPDLKGDRGREIKTTGQPLPLQRSVGAQAQTRSTLKSLLKKAEAAGNGEKVSRIRELLKNLR